MCPDSVGLQEDYQQPYALRSPSITQVETTGAQLTSDSTVNFAVEVSYQREFLVHTQNNNMQPIYPSKKQIQQDDDIDVCICSASSSRCTLTQL